LRSGWSQSSVTSTTIKKQHLRRSRGATSKGDHPPQEVALN
jgi:hypothetical protein